MLPFLSDASLKQPGDLSLIWIKWTGEQCLDWLGGVLSEQMHQ